MAFNKSITLLSGPTGAYLKLAYYHVDDVIKEASGHFHLYLDRTTRLAAPGEPLRVRAVKIRLVGAKYDQYFSPAALAAVGYKEKDQFYAAAKAETALVVSDFNTVGGDGKLVSVLVGATDVLESGQTAA